MYKKRSLKVTKGIGKGGGGGGGVRNCLFSYHNSTVLETEILTQDQSKNC